MAPNIAMPVMNTTTSEYDTTRWRNRSSGRMGSLARRSTTTSAASSAAVAASHGSIIVVVPPTATSRHVTPPNSSAAPSQSIFAAEVRVLGGYAMRDHNRRQDTERQVQVEDPAPRQRVGDIAADERAGNRRDAPDAAEQRLGACALFERVQLADDRHAERDDGAGAQSLDRAKDDQLRHRGRGAGQRGSQDEDGDAGEIQPAAAIEIRQPSPDRHRRRRRQQVCGEHPAVVREAAERGNDGRHRGADHGGLERAEAHAEQQAGGDRLAAALADRQRRRP